MWLLSAPMAALGWGAEGRHWAVAMEMARRYLLPHRPDEVLTARTDDGWSLRVLHYRPQGRAYRQPVVLCHGMGANSYAMDLDERYSMARHLAQRGFHAFVPDLRGRGDSWRPEAVGRHDYSFDDHATYDAPAILHTALQSAGAERAFWVGHSMGGMLGYVVAGQQAERIAGLVTLGAPAQMRWDRRLAQLVRLALHLPFDPLPQRLAAQLIAPFATEWFPPLLDLSGLRSNMEVEALRHGLANAVVDLPRRLLRQFADWALAERPLSENGGFDYREWTARVRAPLLCIAAREDRLAPPVDVRPGYELVRSNDRTWVCLGEDGGQAFGHSDMLIGRGAPDIVYPSVHNWLAARATRQKMRRTGLPPPAAIHSR